MSKCGSESCSGNCKCEKTEVTEPSDVGLGAEAPDLEPFVCAVVQGVVVEGVVNGFRVGIMHLILASLNNGGYTAIEIVLSREEMLEWSDMMKATGSSIPPLAQQIERKNNLTTEEAPVG